MKVINRLNLPQPIVEVLASDNYSKGNADFSATELIDSPRVKQLTKRHYEDITVDCADLLYQFDGKAVHSLLEQAEVSEDVGLIEKRLEVQVGVYTISGAIDYYDVKRGIIQDYKRVSTWEVVMGIKEEREQQLNIYAHLARENGWVVNALEIVYLFRDWSEARSTREKDYPKDRAQRGNKFLSQEVATAWMNSNGKTRAEHYVETRVGEPRRCLKYCNVASFCNQWSD